MAVAAARKAAAPTPWSDEAMARLGELVRDARMCDRNGKPVWKKIGAQLGRKAQEARCRWQRVAAAEAKAEPKAKRV